MAKIPIAQIIPDENTRQPNADRIEYLVKSMSINGQKTPIQVYYDGSYYHIIFGFGRYEAAKKLLWDSIWAIIVDEPAKTADLYVENMHRSGLGYLETARIFQALKDQGMTQKDIAAHCLVSEADVSLAISALKADPKIKQALEDGRLKPSAAEPLLSQPLDVQNRLADAAIMAKTTRKVRALVMADKFRNNAQDTVIADNDPLEDLAIESLKKALECIQVATSISVTENVSEYNDLWERIEREICRCL